MAKFADIDLHIARGIRASVERSKGNSFSDAEFHEWIRIGLCDRAATIFVEMSRGAHETEDIEIASLDGLLESRRRKENGIYFTPPWLAERVSKHLDR